MTTPILTDDITPEESIELAHEQRAIARTRANAYGLPWKGEADPRLLVAGDVVALYAGNDSPQYTATIEATEHDDIERIVNFETTAGPYCVPYGMKVWVCAYAPLLGE